jgi:hypothetical protein
LKSKGSKYYNNLLSMKLTSAIALSLLAKSVYGVADHLWYSTSLSNVTDWYNEVTIHSGDEPEGTYFMTNGFTGGYFGIQHNVPNKTVLFSVWVSMITVAFVPSLIC